MTSPSLARRNFGNAAADYASNSYHAAGPDLRMLDEAANLSGDERVLDCGTGAGHTALLLAPRAREVVGVDITEEMLAEARALAKQRGLANVTFEAADACALPYESGSFDVVSNRQSAHHYADLGRALDETRRVLRPGGRFLLIDTIAPEDAGMDTFLNCVELLRDDSHVRDRPASEWVRLLEQRGFAVTVHHRFVIPLDGADWTKRMRTPPSKVAMIRELFANATPAQRAAFDLRDDPWGWTIESVLIEAVKL